MARRGRPRLPEGQARNEIIMIRATPREKEIWNECAKEIGDSTEILQIILEAVQIESLNRGSVSVE